MDPLPAAIDRKMSANFVADYLCLSDRILILDFGSQYSHLIVRRCRELGVYSELKRCDVLLDEISSFKPKGIILSGGPFSVYEAGSPHVAMDFWEWVSSEGIPLLGICYGLQEMMHHLGGKVENATEREFGPAQMRPTSDDPLLDGVLDEEEMPNGVMTQEQGEEKDTRKTTTRVWMSHGDKVTVLARGFQVIAVTENSEFAAVSDTSRRMWGLQFHPEVTHTVEGRRVIENFVLNICGARPSWTMNAFATTEIERLREVIGQRHVVGAVSGGVDSTVAAVLLHRAVGTQFHGFLVDTGLLRKNEGTQVIARLRRAIPGLQIECVDASSDFFNALQGITDPEEKRKIIGRLFIEQFERVAKSLDLPTDHGTPFLLQGTLYPDVIESVSIRGPSHTIKTHHNVGGLPERMNMEVLEPLRELFKDEVRKLGLELGIEEESVWRHPFPGPGLAIRIVGEVTRDRAEILKAADAIFIEELKAAGLYRKIGQAFAVLLPDAKSVGVMGDARTYEMTVVLRAVATSDYMTAEWYPIPYDVLGRCSSRIINEVKGVNRVVYDISSKPPATIEWE